MDAYTTLNADIQKKLAGCYTDAECRIFSGIKHEDYFTTDEVVKYVKESVFWERTAE